MTAEDLLDLLRDASDVARLPAYCSLLARKLVQDERRRRGALAAAASPVGKSPALRGDMDCPICLKEVSSLCEAAHFVCECECLCHWDCARLLGADTSMVKCPTCRAEGPVGSVREDLEHLRALCRLIGAGPEGVSSGLHLPRTDGVEVIEALKRTLPSTTAEALDALSERLNLEVAPEQRSLNCDACRRPFERFSDVQTVSCNCREPWALHASCAAGWSVQQLRGCPRCHAQPPLDVFSVKVGLKRMGHARSSRAQGGVFPLTQASAVQLRRRRVGRFIPCLR